MVQSERKKYLKNFFDLVNAENYELCLQMNEWLQVTKKEIADYFDNISNNDYFKVVFYQETDDYIFFLIIADVDYDFTKFIHFYRFFNIFTIVQAKVNFNFVNIFIPL